MTLQEFLDEFGTLAESAEGVPKLRALVLQLAVRGRLTSEGGTNGGGPYPIPPHWHWETLVESVDILDSQRQPIKAADREARIAGKPQHRLYPYYGATQQAGVIDDYIFDEELVLLGEDGVPFFDSERPKAYVISGKSWVNNHAHVLRGRSVANRFLCHVLNVADYSGRITGTTRLKLNQGRMKSIPVPVPPLAEQHRIVSKVDELMGLCDRLEAAQEQRRGVRARLSRASLHRLTNTTAKSELTSAWQRVCDQFEVLYDTPETLPDLRQTILQLAVQGKLVPQDPGDEPAEVLLSRIRDAKSAYMAERGIRPEPNLVCPSNADAPFGIPAGWAWSRLGNVQVFTNGYAFKSSEYRKAGVGIVRMRELSKGEISEVHMPFVDNKYLTELSSELQIFPGDLLMGMSGSIGKLAFNTSDQVYLLNQRVGRLHPILVDKTFLSFFLATMESEYLRISAGSAVKNLSTRQIKETPIPIPPLLEQKRIVSKVTNLLSQVTRLESTLTRRESTRTQLLTAAIHSLLQTEQP